MDKHFDMHRKILLHLFRNFFTNYKVYLKTYSFIQLKSQISNVKLANMSFFEKSVEFLKKICYTFKQVLKSHFCLISNLNREAIGCE